MNGRIPLYIVITLLITFVEFQRVNNSPLVTFSIAVPMHVITVAILLAASSYNFSSSFAYLIGLPLSSQSIGILPSPYFCTPSAIKPIISPIAVHPSITLWNGVVSPSDLTRNQYLCVSNSLIIAPPIVDITVEIFLEAFSKSVLFNSLKLIALPFLYSIGIFSSA